MARGLVDRVVVGADRVAANGDVANKVGTYPLAVLAAAPRHPLLRRRAALDPRPGHAGRRGHPDRGARPRARSWTARRRSTWRSTSRPAELVSAIFTEAGVLEPPYPDAIRRSLARPEAERPDQRRGRTPRGGTHERRRAAPLRRPAAARARASAAAATWWARSQPPRPAASTTVRSRVVGGVTWERRVIDPAPGPRSSGRDRGRPRAGARRARRGRRSARVRDSGVRFAEGRVAELLGEETVLVDVTRPPARAGRVAASGRRASWAATCSSSSTSAATRSPTATRTGSPAPSATRSCSRRPPASQRERDVLGGVFGIGCDGELDARRRCSPGCPRSRPPAVSAAPED